MKNLLRREFLKGMVTVPFLGYFAIAHKPNFLKAQQKSNPDYMKDLGVSQIDALNFRLVSSNALNYKPVRFGLVGHGWRGPDLLRALGFAHHSWIEKNTISGKYNDEVISFLNQEDLNVEFTGVCDTFTPRATKAVAASVNPVYPEGRNRERKPVKIYPTYRDMFSSGEIDAVIIATPDHLHAKMASDAVKAGLHVYLEKPMTRTIDEAIRLRNEVKGSGIVFQLGHENRHQLSYRIAEELIKKNVIGDVSMVETFTNRNDDFGAWIRGIDKEGNLDTINWKEFLGDSPWQEFDPDKYFNWQRFNEFGSGVTGNQFSHYYDCINQILHIGIPESVAALGGTYYFKDRRDIPDVLNVIFNYPAKRLSLTYDCTLKNSKFRGISIMGADGYMEIENNLNVYKDSLSKKYKKIQVDPANPIFKYFPDPRVDAVSSATALTYIKSGFGKTMIDGQILDTTYLHMKEWIDAIRGQGSASCNIDRGFEEAVTYILANISLKEKKIANWDAVNEKVILS